MIGCNVASVPWNNYTRIGWHVYLGEHCLVSSYNHSISFQQSAEITEIAPQPMLKTTLEISMRLQARLA